VSNTDNYDIKSYDIYNRGYKSGAQAFVFLGPIWIEETSFFQIDRSDTKKPVYGYNEVKFDRLLQGRYLVQGTLGINYIESNYLTKTIKKVQEESIMRGTLQDLIVNRKSLFLERMKSSETLRNMVSDYGLDQEGTIKIDQFVKRLCNEAELAAGSNGSILDPTNFELTFVFGDMYDTTQSIEIYEGVQISSSGIRSGNDDSVTMEIYNWTARGMKEAEAKLEKEKYQYSFKKSNLLTMAKEVSDQLVEKLLADPIIDVHANKSRTRLMNNTMKLGVAGMLHPRTRMFGRGASFIEMVYALELDLTFDKITSDTSIRVEVQKDNSLKSTATNTNDIKLTVPNQKIAGAIKRAFDNSFGKLVSINREHSAEKIKAISPVKIESLIYKLGGSIALPQYRKNTFNIGSFIPPTIRANTSEMPFIYTDADMEAITYSTLWCCLTGYRGIAASQDPNLQEEPTPVINEISQPLYSFAYIDSVKGEYKDGDNYNIDISMPTYIDFMNLHKSGVPSTEKLGKDKTKEPMAEITDTDIIRIEYSKDNNGKDNNTISAPNLTDKNADIFKESIIYASYKKVENIQMIETDAILPTGEVEGTPYMDFDNFKPNFFKFSIQNNSPMLASDFHKSLYIVPFIYEEKIGDDLPASGNDLNTNQTLKNLAYLLSKNNNIDDSCTYDMDYDWVCTDVSGIQTVNGNITVNGVYFLNPKNAASVGKNVHVIWIMALLPIKREITGSKVKSINLIHDISTLGGRYAEFYNITRCDNLYHITSIYDMYDPHDSIIAQIIGGIIDVWDSLKNIFLEDYESNYALPVKMSLDRICGFMDGYAITLNINNIINQILQCEFTSDQIRSFLPDSKGPIVLETALQKAMGIDGTSGNSAVRKELASIISASINDKIEIKGANIIDNRDDGTVTIEMNVPVPPTDVVSWGLLDNGSGAEALLELKDKNKEYKKDPNSTDTNTPTTALKLGGYSAII